MRAVKLAFLIILFPAIVLAQKTYTLQGKITDAQNGEALPGANVMLKGTYYGAATDVSGNYRIPGVKEGTYNLEISLIGYKVIQRTALVVNDTSHLTNDFKLQSSALTLGTDIVVIGEKPLLDIESTESKKTIGSKEIEASVIENVTDLIRNQPGVVAEKNEIHIRGGRAYENSYLIDGLSIQDPFSGGTSGLMLSANSIEEVEVLTGGFNAEYGQSMSGVIEVKTKRGSEKLKGQFTYKTDKIGISNDNSDVGELSLSGPIPFTGKKGSFFVSGYALLSDTYLPHSHDLYSSIFGGSKYALRGSNNYSGLFKGIWEFSPTKKLVFSISGSANIDQGFSANEFENPTPDFNSYPFQYQYDLNNYNTQTRISNQTSFTWTHTTSPSFFYEMR
ncbi:MAG TPA: hypothetical protein DEO84_09850, partial [candidate division Zixibacteria bacterium]|nr:hypothetical protein [candidate division Zixibacteria bacterium]